jgi:hypothetical protein
MFYKLLGIAVWKGSKALLRAKYGSAMAPKPLLAAGLALAAAGVLVAVLKHGGDE